MPSAQVNTVNCLILESKTALKHIPTHIPVYFINSKRRFFIYFKSHRQMLQAIRIFTQNGVRFYQRESLLPDREEMEEQVYHCSYRYKKMDLRRNLLPSTPYNQPKSHFDKYQKVKHRYEVRESPKKNEVVEQMMEEKKTVVVEPTFNGHRFKNPDIVRMLENKELINSVLLSLNLQ